MGCACRELMPSHRLACLRLAMQVNITTCTIQHPHLNTLRREMGRTGRSIQVRMRNINKVTRIQQGHQRVHLNSAWFAPTTERWSGFR